MANCLRKLMPKEEKFFPLFDEHADLVGNAAEQRRVLLSAPSNDGAADLDRCVS